MEASPGEHPDGASDKLATLLQALNVNPAPASEPVTDPAQPHDHKFPIVISYTSEAEAEMLQVAEALRARFGEDCVAHGLMCEGGRAWYTGYFEWLKHADVVLILLSPSYFQRSACREEFEAACVAIKDWDKKRKVLPVVVQSLKCDTNAQGYPTDMTGATEYHKVQLGKRNCRPRPSEGILMDDFEANMQVVIDEISPLVDRSSLGCPAEHGLSRTLTAEIEEMEAELADGHSKELKRTPTAEIEAVLAEGEELLAMSTTRPVASGSLGDDAASFSDLPLVAAFCTDADHNPNVRTELRGLKELMTESSNMADVAVLELRPECSQIVNMDNAIILWQPSGQELRDTIQNESPYLLHLAGHNAGHGGLRLLSIDNITEIGPEELARVIGLSCPVEDSNLECIVLNFCHSKPLAELLNSYGYKYVVYWENDTSDKACELFTEGFYSSRLKGLPYAKCFEAGRLNVDLCKETLFILGTDNRVRTCVAESTWELEATPALLTATPEYAGSAGEEPADNKLNASSEPMQHEVTITLQGKCEGQGELPPVVSTFQQELRDMQPNGKLSGLPDPNSVSFFIRWQGDLSQVPNAHQFLDEFEEDLKELGVKVKIRGLDAGSIVMLVRGSLQSYEKAQQLKRCQGLQMLGVQLQSVSYVVESKQAAEALEQRMAEVLQACQADGNEPAANAGEQAQQAFNEASFARLVLPAHQKLVSDSLKQWQQLRVYEQKTKDGHELDEEQAASYQNLESRRGELAQIVEVWQRLEAADENGNLDDVERMQYELERLLSPKEPDSGIHTLLTELEDDEARKSEQHSDEESSSLSASGAPAEASPAARRLSPKEPDSLSNLPAMASSEERAMLGPSVHTLDTHFAELCAQEGVPLNEERLHGTGEYASVRLPKVYDITEKVLLGRTAKTRCTRDGREGAALVDLLEEMYGCKAIGRARLMLSYTWGYELAAIVGALKSYCTKNGLDPKSTYVWICFACINQHRVKEQQERGESVPPEAFRAEFEARVIGTGHVLSMLAPWSDPANLKRVWCLFEAFSALTLKEGCTFEIIMPPSEQASFGKALVYEFDTIKTCLSRLDVKKADATVAQDKATILRLVEEEMGFVAVNRAVMGALHDWLGKAGKAALDELSEEERGTSRLINNLGMLYQDQGKLEEAEQLYLEALGASRATLGDRHPSTLTSIANLGLLYTDQGKLEEAEQLMLEALDAERATLGDRHPDTLTSINNLGGLYRGQGKLEEAEQLMLEALDASRATLGDRHPHTLSSINNLGSLYQAQGKLEEAEQLYLEALDARRATLGDRHPRTLSSINNLGSLYQDQGKLEEAEQLMLEALDASRATLGDRHPHTLNTQGNLGMVLMKQQRPEGVEMVESVLEQLQGTHEASHPWIRKFKQALEVQQARSDEITTTLET